MKVGMDHVGQITDEKLRFFRQMGVEGIMVNPEAGDTKGYFDYADLLLLKTRLETYGLKIGSVGASAQWSWNYKWMMGLPGRDEQIENWQRTIRNMGAVGIPLFTYNIHALRFFRTSRHTPVRGGALSSSFDADLVKNAPLFAGGRGTNMDLVPASHRHPISEEQMWENLRYFLQAVVPVAEEAGVLMGLHPDDPQVPEIGGVARIIRSPEAYRRAIEMVPSKNNGLLFCVGCFTEMGADVLKEIRYFGERKKIFWVHFRNITGTTEKFMENFPDEGQADLLAVAKALHKVGYDGYLTPDHPIRVEGDSDWGHRYWAYCFGFTKAMIMAAKAK
jgi:mannonate dehydratase